MDKEGISVHLMCQVLDNVDVDEDGADNEDNDNDDDIDDEKVDWASLGWIRRARPPL